LTSLSRYCFATRRDAILVTDVKISAEVRDVLSDVLVELAGVSLVSIPGYVLAQEWLRLTLALIFCILTIRLAIQLRKKPYDQSE
jgi:hypothetical protein